MLENIQKVQEKDKLSYLLTNIQKWVQFFGQVPNLLIHHRIRSGLHGSASDSPVAAAVAVAVAAVVRMAELEFVVAAVAGEVHGIGFETGVDRN